MWQIMWQTQNVTAKTNNRPPQHKTIPGNMEASDETLDREAGNDMTKV